MMQYVQKTINVITLMSLLLLCSCALSSMGSTAMTMNRFHEISVGMNIKELVAVAGRPYEIKKTSSPGVSKYIYFERFTAMPGQERQMRRYVVKVSNGRVVEKSYELEGESLSDYTLNKNAT